MPIRRVEQVDDDGCFVACTAMLTGRTYQDALTTLYPNLVGKIGRPPVEARQALERLGVRILAEKKVKKIETLKRTSLVIIQWALEPHLAHAVVWDACQKKLLDPCYDPPLPIRTYERQLFNVLVVDRKSLRLGTKPSKKCKSGSNRGRLEPWQSSNQDSSFGRRRVRATTSSRSRPNGTSPSMR